MSNASNQNSRKSTSSGQGALGMGGQPSDDPRDMHGGGWNPDDDRTSPVGGASGNERRDMQVGNVTGVEGDKAVSAEIDKLAKKAAAH